MTEILDIPKNSILAIKAKDYSAALNVAGQLLVWHNPRKI